MTRRSILPSFLRHEETSRCVRPRGSFRPLPPTPAIDRYEGQGVSLVSLARVAVEVAR